MTSATHNELRARVCDVIRQLGAALDGLATAAECNRLPGDPAVDAFVTLQHLEESAYAVESASTLMHDLADFIDRTIEAEKAKAGPLAGGGT